MSGIHHVTALAGDPQRNLDFYTGILGLRLVKRTVNFDDPASYHLYYGDATGSPGTLLTFFAYPSGLPGRRGTGQAVSLSLSIPETSTGYWAERLTRRGIEVQPAIEGPDDEGLTFHDPDGMRLRLVPDPLASSLTGWSGDGIDAEHAIRGLHGVTMWEEGLENTAQLLTDVLGLGFGERRGNRFRYQAPDGELGGVVDIVCRPNAPPGRLAVGCIHHVAWRAATDEQQESLRARLTELSYNVTPVLDRRYFRSVYFREPGGVLLEIATDAPGFAVDEARDHLGSALKLPPWLEKVRGRIERRLPELRVPAS